MLRPAIVAILLILSLSSAHAGLVGSKHDFSQLGGYACAYCHSVHSAVGGIGRPAYMGPLPQITKIYSSATIAHRPTLDSVNKSDAPLCLTCHDGTNVVNLGKPALAALIVGTRVDLNSDGKGLSNDHPVGFVYNAALNTSLKIPTGNIHVTFGPERNEMWCASCHNPHNNTYPPFLAVSNDGSALCLECHIK